jgi:hypothetical protein
MNVVRMGRATPSNPRLIESRRITTSAARVGPNPKNIKLRRRINHFCNKGGVRMAGSPKIAGFGSQKYQTS